MPDHAVYQLHSLRTARMGFCVATWLALGSAPAWAGGSQYPGTIWRSFPSSTASEANSSIPGGGMGARQHAEHPPDAA